MASWKDLLPWPIQSYNAPKLALLHLFDFLTPQKLDIPITRRPLKTVIGAWEPPLLARLDGGVLLFFTIAHSRGDDFIHLVRGALKKTSEEYDVLRSFLLDLDRLEQWDAEGAVKVGIRLRDAFVAHHISVIHLKEFSICVLGNIIIPFYCTSSRVVPQTSTPAEIEKLLVDADFSSDILQDIIYLRDDKKCPLSQIKFGPDSGGEPVLASIVPCSFGKPSKRSSLQILEMFWNQKDVANLLNTPQNFFVLDAATAYQRFIVLDVAVEAVQSPGQSIQYVLRDINIDPQDCELIEDGSILPIGTSRSQRIQHSLSEILPNPGLCNLRLSISRIAHMSGAAGFLSNVFGNEDSLRRAGMSEYGLHLNQTRAIDSLFFKKLAFEASRAEMEYLIPDEF
ncbi:hypothetical protein K435DRAFT_866131 [Dendrothele bispora CBS 962.96]|uniref:Uncharacterized protein n=1 Tax=Dendrothele bispora (strain CBS 962.96) TaxID=1314807 RepID=A0A4V4HDW6_DENBC|nr:hypothetical protein K435DRAFT_866131 [Dendrothele bispora CBS 962.96]